MGLCVRVAAGGYGSLEAGRQAEAAGTLRAATLEYRQAMVWSLPVAPWRAEAKSALERLSQAALADSDWELAAERLNMLRAGILGGRSLLGTDADALESCDVLLAGALARWDAASAVETSAERPGIQEQTARFKARLSADVMPSRFWGFAASAGFVIWLLGAAVAAGVAGRRRASAWWVSLGGGVLFLLGFLLA